MTRTLALIDGSVYSESVCGLSAWVAERTGAAVDLVHVLGRRETTSEPFNLSGNIGFGARSALLEELAELDAQRAKLAQKRGRALLDAAHKTLTDKGLTDVSAKLLKDDLVETVKDYEPQIDLIVIGKRGEAADFAKLHLGSNLERVARASHKPVLVAARAFKPIEKVLVAFDGGTSAMKAVEHIAKDPLFKGLAIHLLTVGTETDEDRAKLETARQTLESAGLDVTAEIRPGTPETVIHESVETGGYELLVMGAYGHSRVRSLIIGSTTTEMIRSVFIPVMLFR